jgi:hypothetical protein
LLSALPLGHQALNGLRTHQTTKATSTAAPAHPASSQSSKYSLSAWFQNALLNQRQRFDGLIDRFKGADARPELAMSGVGSQNSVGVQ